MYGNLNEKKLTQKDMALNCSNIRNEFEQEIDKEHKRVNVDSSKKKAVLYKMDYDGFRQMVLGANLYTLKSNEFNDFNLQYKSNEKVLNSQLNSNIPTEEEIQQFQLRIKEIQCKNFRDFRTSFQKLYILPLNEESFIQIFNLLQSQEQQNIKSIFSYDFQIQYFFQILEVFKYGLLNDTEQQGNQLCFIVAFLKELIGIKDFMQQITMFLKKTEKQQIVDFIMLLNDKLQLEYQDAKFNKELFVAFDAIKSTYM